MELSIDDLVAKKVVENCSLFEHIHPNIITLSGVFFTYLIYRELFKKSPSIALLWFLLAARWLTDVLDGAVARKYNKKSKIGGLLDTVSDFIFMSVIAHYFIRTFNLSCYWYVVVLIIEFIFIYGYGALYDHDIAKKYNSDVKDIFPFFVRNTIISFIIIFFVIYYVINVRK